MSYCLYCANQPIDSLHRLYHDEHYGFPISCDNELFGRLILEINQAGLSWDTILKKEEGFRKAYSDFNIAEIAQYNEDKVNELMLDSSIIRNKLKIQSVIHNARRVCQFQEDYGGFSLWIESFGKQSTENWVKIFRKEFKFVGKEIVVEFLMSAGFLKGAHIESCPVFEKILEKKPNWLSHEK